MKKISELLAPLFKKASSVPENTEDISLRKRESNYRKCIYVRSDTHDIITKIVRINPNSKITVGSFVDSILWEYLRANKDEINELYRQEREDLIKLK